MENDNRMYCPIIKNECIEKQCALYVTGVNRCAINSIAQSLDTIEDKIQYED